jgi:ribonuclease HII
MELYEVGLDEVGRGALAGPVVVAAALVIGRPFGKATLKDSKKLSAKQREVWYRRFLNHPKIVFAVARVYPREIEKRNISQAANLAASRAYKKLVAHPKLNLKKHHVFLDGGLYLGNKLWQSVNVRSAKTLPKADENIAAVAVASIIAKVQRDRFMCRLANQYPAYGFEVHKGYGTKRHQAALARAGACYAHRKTFLKVL